MRCPRCKFNNSKKVLICEKCGFVMALNPNKEKKAINKLSTEKYKQQRKEARKNSTIYDKKEKDNKEIDNAYKEVGYIIKDYEYNEISKETNKETNKEKAHTVNKNIENNNNNIKQEYNKTVINNNAKNTNSNINSNNTKYKKLDKIRFNNTNMDIVKIIIGVVIIATVILVSLILIPKKDNKKSEKELFQEVSAEEDSYDTSELTVYGSEDQVMYNDQYLKISTNLKNATLDNKFKLLVDIDNKSNDIVKINVDDISINWMATDSYNESGIITVDSKSKEQSELIIWLDTEKIKGESISDIEFRLLLEDKDGNIKNTNKVEITKLETNKPRIKSARAVKR